MYPLKDQALSIADCANHWARCIEGSPDQDEVRLTLLQAVLHAHLPAYTFSTSPQRMSRGRLLDALALSSDAEDCGVVFCTPGSAPQSSWEQPDGSLIVDTRIVIEANRPLTDLPAAELDGIVSSLGRLRWEDLPIGFMAGFGTLHIRHDDFAHYCDAAGYRRPSFWFAAGEQRRRPDARAAAARDCRTWLEAIAKGPKARSKDDYFEDAIRRFPGLNRAGFDSAWSEAVPVSWARQRPRRA